jgi:threonine synthase
LRRAPETLAARLPGMMHEAGLLAEAMSRLSASHTESRERRRRATSWSNNSAAFPERSSIGEAMRDLHKCEGIDATEEGGATLAALRLLLSKGAALPTPVVLFNTATSLKYAPR